MLFCLLSFHLIPKCFIGSKCSQPFHFESNSFSNCNNFHSNFRTSLSSFLLLLQSALEHGETEDNIRSVERHSLNHCLEILPIYTHLNNNTSARSEWTEGRKRNVSWKGYYVVRSSLIQSVTDCASITLSLTLTISLSLCVWKRNKTGKKEGNPNVSLQITTNQSFRTFWFDSNIRQNWEKWQRIIRS